MAKMIQDLKVKRKIDFLHSIQDFLIFPSIYIKKLYFYLIKIS